MKKFWNLIPAALVLLGCSSSNQSVEGELVLREDNIEQIIGAMTLEEKCHFVVGSAQKDVLDSADLVFIADCRHEVPGCAGTTFPIPRLGIPAVVLADGPAGLRIKPTRENDENTYYCTGFPIGTLLASSWDPALVREVGKAMGNEVLEYGVDVLLAPGLNIHRNPMCGRNFEYYSEDPLLAGKIAAAMVQGVQSNGVGTSIKHFAANSCEINRLASDSRISQKALREIYLKPFEIAVKEADPWTVMTSYNYLNGVYTSESVDLLENILRGDWGYKGTVMTDWGGGQNPVAQMVAGNDMIQPGRGWMYTAILEAVKDGSLDESALDACVRRILNLVVRTPHFKKYEYSSKPDLVAHAAVSRDAAAQSMVLLENRENTLPLEKESKLALFGVGAYDLVAGGFGSGDVNKAYVINLDQAVKEAGYTLDSKLDAAYRAWMDSEKERLAKVNEGRSWFFAKDRAQEMPLEGFDALAKDAAEADDAAVVCIVRTSGEGTDRHVKDDFLLKESEVALLNIVTEAFHAKGKSVSVVLNIGGVIEMASWKDSVDAVLLAWQPGQEAGYAIMDVLSGDVNPCGRLPMTFPVEYADVPSQNFPFIEGVTGKNDSFYRYSKTKLYEMKDFDYVDYTEDVYVGYRYYSSFCVPVTYLFGYGLSYTDFSLENLKVKTTREGWKVSLTVKNVGAVAGRDVVELFASEVGGSSVKAERSCESHLRAFAKTSLLYPGQSEKVCLEIKAEDVAVFDEQASQWVSYKGDYDIFVVDGFKSILSDKMSLRKELRRDVSRSLSPVCPDPGVAPEGQLFIDPSSRMLSR